jgi:hypothetical protein
MKKLLLSVAMVASLINLTNTLNAQIATGGIPLSISNGLTSIVPTTKTYQNPIANEEAINEVRHLGTLDNKVYVAKTVATDIKFPESGVFHYLDNGQIVWKSQIEIPYAPAIGLYFNNFDLPEGVNMYIYNANASQMLGAYTMQNVSPEDKLFAVQPVQGNFVNIELNIDPYVNMNSIGLNVNKAAIHFEGISYLEQYKNSQEGVFIGTDVYGLEGRGAVCMIDAACETDPNYDVAKRSTIQTLYLNETLGLVSMCSAALINSLGNSTQNCKNYVLTASHCQSSSTTMLGDTVNTPFTQVLLRFNFEKLVCNSFDRAQVDVLSSVNFVARSEFDRSKHISEAKGDWLLLETRIRIPQSYNALMAGWNLANQANYPQDGNKKYIGFHHPSGDIKKVSWSSRLSGVGASSLHYTMTLPVDGSNGAVHGGTSGSALYNYDNEIIGIASTASGAITDCAKTYNRLNYYKFSSGYYYDTTAATGSAQRNIQSWLDPFNSGKRKAAWSSTDCTGGPAASSITFKEGLEKGINFYPNPSNTGMVNVKFDFAEKQNVTLEIYSALGAKVGELQVNNVTKGDYALDLTSVNSGIYMIKCYNGTDLVTKKVTIAR